jgi:uncharacterized protein
MFTSADGMHYDPARTPDGKRWLDTDEAERLGAMQEWAENYFGEPDEDFTMLVAPMLVVENQLACGQLPEAVDTMARLQAAGLDRLTALLAMADAVSLATRAALDEGAGADLDLQAELVARYAAIDAEKLVVDPVEPDHLLGGGWESDDEAFDDEFDEESLEHFERRQFDRVPAFDEKNRRLLDDFAQRHDESGAMGFAEAAGFFFGIHACPHMVMPSEWTEIVQGDAIFDDEDEARTILNARMALYNWVAKGFSSDWAAIPVDCRPSPDPMDDVDNDTTFSKWCRGVCIADAWLEESWQTAVREGSPDEQALFRARATLSFFADREAADAIAADIGLEPGQIDSAARSFRFGALDSILDYQEIGFRLRRTPTPPRQPARSEKIGRNQPCPCGSGKKYKKCCGGFRQVH